MDKGATKEPVTSTPALPVAIGVKADGHKVVLAVSSGYRESTASWSARLRDLKARGMNEPRLPAGCGKTTLGRLLLRAIDPTSGEVTLYLNGNAHELTAMRQRELRSIRRHMQMVFQDPFSSLSPRMTVLELIGEPLRLNGVASGVELQRRVMELMDVVGLNVNHLKRYPNAFSGGQRQRIGIARALALRPELIVADEPVSALDVSIQAQILNLLQDLQAQFNLTYVFITHDLSVVEHISDRIAVMYAGKIVELATKEALFRRPRHPYTATLLAAVPNPDPDIPPQQVRLSGEVADLANLPAGCAFHPRCPHVGERWRSEVPALEQTEPRHMAACHFANELDLRDSG